MCGQIMTVLLSFVLIVLMWSMARYNGRLHCIVGVLPTCYKRKAATYFYPPGGTGPNVRTNMHTIKTIIKFCAHWSLYDEFRRRWDSNSESQVCAALQRPIISKCQHSAKFGNTVHIKFSLLFANLCWLAK